MLITFNLDKPAHAHMVRSNTLLPNDQMWGSLTLTPNNRHTFAERQSLPFCGFIIFMDAHTHTNYALYSAYLKIMQIGPFDITVLLKIWPF